MPGPINLYDSIHLKLPKTLDTPEGDSIALQWFIQAELPNKSAVVNNPHGVFSILNQSPTTRVRQYHGSSTRTEEDTDVFAYADGTLTYEVEEQDIDSVTSVDGFVGAAPFTFVEDTDFTVQSDGITFLEAGTLPDDASNVTIVYDYTVHVPLFLQRSTLTARAIVRVKEFTAPSGRQYQKSVGAQVLGEALEQHIRRQSGDVMQKPVAGGNHEDYHLEASLGKVISSRPIFIDQSESLAGWAVDFQIKRAQLYEDAGTQAIKTAGVTGTATA